MPNYTGINVEVFDRFFLWSTEKDIEAVKKTKKRETQIIISQGPINNDIEKINTENSIWKPGWSGGLFKNNRLRYFKKVYKPYVCEA